MNDNWEARAVFWFVGDGVIGIPGTRWYLFGIRGENTLILHHSNILNNEDQHQKIHHPAWPAPPLHLFFFYFLVTSIMVTRLEFSKILAVGPFLWPSCGRQRWRNLWSLTPIPTDAILFKISVSHNFLIKSCAKFIINF